MLSQFFCTAVIRYALSCAEGSARRFALNQGRAPSGQHMSDHKGSRRNRGEENF
jgi:hypothetical protein